jgi:hypothetical protein
MRKTSSNRQFLATLILALGTAVGGYLSRGTTVINNHDENDRAEAPLTMQAPLSMAPSTVSYHPAIVLSPDGSLKAAVLEFEAAADQLATP